MAIQWTAQTISDGLRCLRRKSMLPLALGVLCLSTDASAISFLPGGICTDAGFPKGDTFRETCVSRVLKERRSRAWREQAPYALMGAVAGVAANGGSAAGFVSIPGQTNLRQLLIGSQSFIVHVPTETEATVVSAERYKNIPKEEVDLWVRAASQASGCRVVKYVRDFDALYTWTECTKSAPAVATQPVATVQASSPAPSVADELAKLSALRDKGALSPQEFQAAKARILGQ